MVQVTDLSGYPNLSSNHRGSRHKLVKAHGNWAVERLMRSGNPKSLQYHLGHSNPLMTMRSLNTLQQEEALQIQQQVDFKDI